MKNTAKLKNIINKLKKARVMVIGDLILDEFIWGNVSRISPEAPIPVVEVINESFMPGGAANVANNIRSLGGEVTLVGLIGRDSRGKTLNRLLKKKGVNIQGIIATPDRPTTLKSRIIAHRQQVVRVDKEKVEPISSKLLDKTLTKIKALSKNVDAFLIEDYGKGIIVPALIKEVVKIAKKKKIMVTVDPKENHIDYYKGVTAVTPNQFEAGKAIGIEIKDKKSLYRAGKKLLDLLKAKAALITLGENGMCLFQKNGRVIHIPTMAKEVFDVSGAGDTVIGAFTLSLAVGADMEEAAYLSNYAAGIVVGKVGVAVATRSDLKAALV